MKTVVRRAIKDEKGAALALALVLLVVGGLVLTPLLGLMSTGLLAGQVYERHAHRLYAADAAVEDAIWKIKYDPPDSYPYPYPEPLIVDGKSVAVTIFSLDDPATCENELRYRILSTVMADDGGGTAAIVNSTTIDAHLSVSYMDVSNLLDNAIVSDTHIGIKNGVSVTGNVTSGGTVDNKSEGVNGTITEYAELDWPSAGDLSAWYLEDVKNETAYDSDTIDLAGFDEDLEPVYRAGELTIKNSGGNNAALKLTGTLYITGDTLIGQTEKDFILDLNGHTIFVESSSADALIVGGKCTIVGSGCIIAVGDVYFAPKGNVGSETDFVLVMSVEGTTTIQPSGTFYGCIAGNVCVDVKSGHNATITHTPPEGKDLNFPMGVGDGDKLPPVTGLRIESWEIE